MSNPHQAHTHLLRRLGVAGPACSSVARGTHAPKISRRLILPALATTVAVLAFSTPALAKEVHVYSSSFGSEGSGAEQLKEPQGVAVNNATGDVYVVDKGNNRIDEFESNGTFIRTWGWGAGGGTKFEICTSLCKEGIAGSGEGQLDAPEEIAIDNSGNASDPSKEDVYVTDPSNGTIEKFSATGTYINQITEAAEKAIARTTSPCYQNAGREDLCGIAVDPNGELWVENSSQIYNFSDTIENKYIAARQAIGKKGTESFFNSAFAVDSTEDIYITSSSVPPISKLNSAGKVLINGFGGGGDGFSTGIAIDPVASTIFSETPYETKDGKTRSVSELSAEGGVLETFGEGKFTLESGGANSVGSGLAVNYSSGNAASGAVYATDPDGDYVIIFKSITVPTVTVEPVSNSTTSSVTFEGTVNPEGTPITSCEFEYGTEPGVYPEKASCAPEVSVAKPLTGDTPVAVSATGSGLTQGDTYYYRLSVLAAGETYRSTELSYFLPHTAAITNESAPFVESTRAWLEAEINPGGVETPYHFEYGSAAGAYEVSIPVPDASTGPSVTGVRVGVLAKGLTPGTTYHFRLVASPLSGEVDGADETFTTPVLSSVTSESCANAQVRVEQPYGQTLPDCRAYEMVSPLNKEDNNILFNLSRASVSGEALTYVSPGSFAEPQGEPTLSRYLAHRDPGQNSWSTQNISPPIGVENTNISSPFEELLFTPSLSEGLVKSNYIPLAPGEPAGYFNLDLADFASTPTSYQRVSIYATPPGSGYKEGDGSGIEPAGASTDLSHIVYETSNGGIYEWASGDVNFVGTGDVGAPSNFTGSPSGANTWHAVSDDGSRVFFTVGERANSSTGQLFVRENPEQEQSPEENGKCTIPGDACTVDVSASQRTNGEGRLEPDPNGVKPARYWDASADGSRVFFTSRSELTSDARTGPGDNAANLYEYNVETGALSDLTVDDEAGDGAAVLGLVTAGEDGSYVYFVAEGKLAQGATPGQPNMYLYHAGEVTFIATLAPATKQEGQSASEEGGDSPDWTGNRESGASGSYQGPGSHTARVTSDGTTLAFESELPLTGYDNEQAEPRNCEKDEYHRIETGRCREVYLYSATADEFVCASCNPSGVRPVGPSNLGGEETEGLAKPSTFYLSRNLSEDGRRLFFQSDDALVPHASNGKLNVYEWEAEGEGSCVQAGGCVFSISNVAGDYASHLMDASANGDDVFIATADQLVPSDTDTRQDVYDVRVDGGFPVTVAPSVCDNGDSCKPPASPQPAIFGTPSSATFSGPGNPASADVSISTKKTKATVVKCKKGFSKKKGKCVKNKKKKVKRAKKASYDRRASR